MVQVQGQPDCNLPNLASETVMTDPSLLNGQDGLLALPTELIHTVLLTLPPLCIEHFSQTCKLARHYVYGDSHQGDLHLWRRIYLQRFDSNAALWPASEDDSEDALAPPSSVMSLVQTRDRACRLYSGDPLKQAPIALSFNSVLSALLSVIDTALPNPDLPTSSSRNSQWLNAAIVTDDKHSWGNWLFPRNLMHSLRQFKRDVKRASHDSQRQGGQDNKRRRLTNEGQASSSASTLIAKTSPQSPSKSKTRSAPDSSRRRSARLMKIIYPEELHELIDEGIDIESFAEPEIRLAARLHCLHGIRTWKDSQKQRQTTSPQEIATRTQEAVGVADNDHRNGTDAPTPDVPPAPLGANPADQQLQEQAANDAQEMPDNPLDDFDEPPDAILTFRPRIFGPTFGFCDASDEEDKVRARMRELVYDAGNYSWSNGYGPFHAWRVREDIEGLAGEEEEEDDAQEDEAMPALRAEWGSDVDDEDAASLLDENQFDDEDVPDDPIPIEIEGSSDEEHRPTFRLSDRNGNPVPDVDANYTNPAPVGWDSSEDEHADIEAVILEGARRRRAERDAAAVDTSGWDDASQNPDPSVPNNDDVDDAMPDDAADADEMDAEDDDFDATDEEDEEEEDDEEDDDDMISDDFDPWTPISSDDLTRGHTGSYARQEILEYQKQKVADAKEANKEVVWDCVETGGGLRKKSVHWELLEAIMVVMYANLKEAIWLEDWGVGIKIPKIFSEDGVQVSDPMEAREFLSFPTGWPSSLPNPLPPKPEAKPQDTTDKPFGKRRDDQDGEKPYDWARCESFWAGTYSFLDYRNFLYYNARVARRAREEAALAQDAADKNGSAAGKNRPTTIANSISTPAPSLIGHEEAVGDCLQLRLQLLPKHLAPIHNEEEESQLEDDEFPTLHFRGTTVTYWGTDPPVARGGVYGQVRPIYAPEGAPGVKRGIEGIHWSFTHVYDGEDRWQLEGIQPGPPGTKAPIFGIWTDVMHAGASPNGPFVYWMMDDRPWTEIERLNKQEERATATRNAHVGGAAAR